MTPEGESDNLRNLEQHAAEAKDEQGDNADPETDEQTVVDPGAEDAEPADAAGGPDEGSGGDYGVENDMRPGGPAPGEAEADGPKKSISEDVTGKEETEDMSELHTDD